MACPDEHNYLKTYDLGDVVWVRFSPDSFCSAYLVTEILGRKCRVNMVVPRVSRATATIHIVDKQFHSHPGARVMTI